MTRKIPKPNQERYRYRSGCGFFNYRLHHLVCYLKYNCLKLHLCVLFLTVFKRKWQKLHKKLASYQILSIVPLCGDAGWSSMVARRAHNPKVVGSNPAPATNPFPNFIFYKFPLNTLLIPTLFTITNILPVTEL